MTIDSPQNPVNQRRNWLAVAGFLAAGAGAGLAWWRLKPHAASSDAVPLLWSQTFETPDGAALPMQTFRGRPLVVNFWATWCPPCVEELPLLDRFFRENKANSWQVLGLAVDQPSAVRSFLQKLPLTFPVGMAGLAGTDLSKSLGNLTGALPFTVVLGPEGSIRQRKMGKVNPGDLAGWKQLG